MGRYLGPRCRLSRREKTDLGNKSGIKPFAEKCNSEKIPGAHWQRRGRYTDYGVQLRMKQLIKRYYTVMEKQFRSYYKEADRRKGSTGDNLLKILESRLDNVVYRMGFASTRNEARQLVSHKSILVNGQLVNIPSYQLKIGDTIEIREKAKKQVRIHASLELAASREDSDWLHVDKKAMSGEFTRLPETDELPQEFKVSFVVELYSK